MSQQQVASRERKCGSGIVCLWCVGCSPASCQNTSGDEADTGDVQSGLWEAGGERGITRRQLSLQPFPNVTLSFFSSGLPFLCTGNALGFGPSVHMHKAWPQAKPPCAPIPVRIRFLTAGSYHGLLPDVILSQNSWKAGDFLTNGEIVFTEVLSIQKTRKEKLNKENAYASVLLTLAFERLKGVEESWV